MKRNYFINKKDSMFGKIHIYILFAVLHCSIAIPAAAQPTRTISGVFDYDKACQVMKAINSERQDKGLAPLKMEAALTNAAMLRAAEFAYHIEVEQARHFLPGYDERPNKDDNLTLIGEQRHTTQPKFEHVFLYMEHDLYTPYAYGGFDRIPKYLKDKDKSGAFFSNKMHSPTTVMPSWTPNATEWAQVSSMATGHNCSCPPSPDQNSFV